MSSVSAVTENLIFGVRVASFYPIDKTKLCLEFNEWIRIKQAEYNFIAYKVEINSEPQSIA
jgi:hypothetical protein